MCKRCGFCCIWFEVRQHHNPKDAACPHLQIEKKHSSCLIYGEPSRYQGCSEFDCEDEVFHELFSKWTDFYEKREAWRANQFKKFEWHKKPKKSEKVYDGREVPIL